MKDVLQKILETQGKKPNAGHLRALVNYLRPRNFNQPLEAEQKIHALIAYLKAYPEYQQSFKNYVGKLFSAHNPLNLYTDSGILPSTGFFSETSRRFAYKFLPPLSKRRDLRTLINQVFYKKKDYIWINNLSNQLWEELLEHLGLLKPEQNNRGQSINLNQFHHLINALLILSHRITAIGLEPDLADKLPDMEDLQSPFFALNREVSVYVEKLRLNPLEIYAEEEEDYRQILVMLNQCHERLHYLRRNKNESGVSLRMTYLLVRLEQHLHRLEVLLFIVEKEHRHVWADRVIGLFKQFVEAENCRYSIRRHIGETVSMLTVRVVEHTSEVGVHYAAANKKEYDAMYRYALGGGAIVAVLVAFKALISQWKLPPFGEAFMFSLNYAGGFVLIYILHYTLATKQPAMTASALASAIEQDQKRRNEKHYHRKAVVLLKQIARTQFIALVGNVVMALPAAYVFAWLFFFVTGEHVVPEGKAHKMADELHLWQSGSLFFAAIAGVYLMFSGLVTGYYDNKVVHDKIPQRIKAHPWLRRFIPRRILNRGADYLGENLGGISGNVVLGTLLGVTATVGLILGLPLDIRHVTFGAGALGVAVVGSGHGLEFSQIFGACLGILGIGLVNVTVSFGLTLVVAFRARKLGPKQGWEIILELLQDFRRNPSLFFVPPPMSPPMLQTEEAKGLSSDLEEEVKEVMEAENLDEQELKK